ncbi:MAG: TVP38/TMEM64 family protein [Sphaerochaetaceae bacterium]
MNIRSWISEHKKETVHYLIALTLLMTLSVFLLFRGGYYVSNLVSFSTSHLVATTVIFMLLYALKSVTFGLPYVLLYFTIGTIYPLYIALLLNIIGTIVNLQIPYFLGYKRGNGYVDSIQKRFPFLGRILEMKDKSQFAFTFIVKIIGKIPHEITNLMLGSLHISWPVYISATILALLPTMISTTLMAKNYQQPGSPVFIIAAVIFLATPVISFIYYRKNSVNREESH